MKHFYNMTYDWLPIVFLLTGCARAYVLYGLGGSKRFTFFGFLGVLICSMVSAITSCAFLAHYGAEGSYLLGGSAVGGYAGCDIMEIVKKQVGYKIKQYLSPPSDKGSRLLGKRKDDGET